MRLSGDNFERYIEDVRKLPDFREEMVSKIKRKIKEGTYHFDVQALSMKLIQTSIDEIFY